MNASGEVGKGTGEAIGSETYDLIVAGAGAAGLTAAVTARLVGLDVLLVEASSLVGGTAARSGGVVWIPNNPFKSCDPPDSQSDVLAYVAREAGRCFDARSVGDYIETGHKAVQFLNDHAALNFIGPDVWPDYHQGYPGAREGGRSMRANDFDGRLLGPSFSLLRPPLRSMTLWGGMMVGAADYAHLLDARRSLRSLAHVARIAIRHGMDRLRHARGTRLTGGNALVGRLLHAYLQLGGQLRLETRLKALQVADNRVHGVEVECNGESRTLCSRRGVVLATGGMPANAVLRSDKAFAPGSRGRSTTLAPQENQGDGLLAAIAAGGCMRRDVVDVAAWVPVSRIRWPDGELGWFPHFFDRSKPGFVMVDTSGRRFVNEAASYHDIGRAMLGLESSETPRAYILCDHRAIRRYGVGVVAPLEAAIRQWQARGYLVAARSVEELAHKLDIDARALAESIDRYNENARKGIDPDFRKGESAYDRYIGDASERPNPCVRPLEQAPFYAVAVELGDLGTFQGLAADGACRVLNEDGDPIEGLYVAGNDRCNIFGGTYPAAGITLGPALVFAYRCVLSAAGIDDARANELASRKLVPTSGLQK